MIRGKRVLVRTLIIIASALIAFLVISSSPSKAAGGQDDPPPIISGPSAPVVETSSSGDQSSEDPAPSQPAGQFEPTENDVELPDDSDTGSSSQNSDMDSSDTNNEDATPPLPTETPSEEPSEETNLEDSANIINQDEQQNAVDSNVKAGIENINNGLIDSSRFMIPYLTRDGELWDNNMIGGDENTGEDCFEDNIGIGRTAGSWGDNTKAENYIMGAEAAAHSMEDRNVDKGVTSDLEPKLTRVKLSSQIHKIVEEPITKFLFGMYTRLDSPSDLRGIRKKLFEFIKAHPGEHMATLIKEFNLSPGSISHHLSVLERNGFVISHNDGRYKRYFVKNNGYISTLDEHYKPIISALKNENSKKIILFLLAIPMSTQQQISEALNLHPSTVHWHTNKLQSVGLLSSSRDGKHVRHAVENPCLVLKVLGLIERI